MNREILPSHIDKISYKPLKNEDSSQKSLANGHHFSNGYANNNNNQNGLQNLLLNSTATATNNTKMLFV